MVLSEDKIMSVDILLVLIVHIDGGLSRRLLNIEGLGKRLPQGQRFRKGCRPLYLSH